jgi:hypothetical protein
VFGGINRKVGGNLAKVGGITPKVGGISAESGGIPPQLLIKNLKTQSPFLFSYVYFYIN